MPALTAVSSKSSGHSHADRRPKASFFGAIKNIFGSSNNRLKPRQRRLSILSSGSTDEKQREAEERAQRRNNCLAIRTAKNEPAEVRRLLVDCEFCNPPPVYGEDIDIITPQFTADSVQRPPPEGPVDADEATWNPGLQEWNRLRGWWTRPTAQAVPRHHTLDDVPPDKYFVIYDKMARHTRPLKEPMNLSDAVKLLKAGWTVEGSWPAQSDPDDRWSDEIADPSEKPKTVTAPSTRAPSEQASHVQFDETPHPRTCHPGRISRNNSQMSSLTLQPTRSNTSSLVSVTTDEEADL